VALLGALAPEVMVVVGYGQIIPQSIIDISPRGILNVHASLLPRYRGAAPIQWAIARGETVTGVTIMRIDAGLDTGDLLLASETPIGPEETAIDLSACLARLGADLLVEALRGIEAGALLPRPQDHAQATLAPILKKEDGRIDWRRPAAEIHNRVRGFQPWPGAHTRFRGQTLNIWKSCPAPETLLDPPGALHIERRRLVVACGGGSALEILELQPEGKKRIPAEAFLNGYRVLHNEILGD
jgi:methionyl-tRNA formyltransferase